MSKKGGAVLQKDVPWRASNAPKPIPKIHHSPLLRIPQTPYTDYALSVMQHPNPIGNGLGNEAIVEAAGPDCIVPGQTVPIKLLGLKVLLFYQSLFHSSGYAFIMRENQFSGCYGFLWHLWGNKFACTTSKTQFNMGACSNPSIPHGDFYEDGSIKWSTSCLNIWVWPIEMDLKFMEPIGRELKSIGKFMDSAVDLMNKSFVDR
ncbi:hypothetical protein M9H77_01970 [Catharanthus roseus]|uniref:Uncharacterized protein n=1 Tax=Catharanthus roseus TaxID=4058 RepID=A0ACC0C7J7_CATRO|nr:hypothetical protein M9H77_01970 [Catharanthus roseus]